MFCLGRAAFLAFTVLLMTSALAQSPAQSPHAADVAGRACLDQKERQAAIESGKVIPLAAAMRSAKKRVQGTVVKARLCHGTHGLVYLLTVLARNGKVARLTIDAVKGTLVGSR